MITVRILLATVIMGAVARGIWVLLDAGLGDSLAAQIVSVGVPCAVACVLYGWLTLKMRIPEARQIQQLVMSRLRRA
jgi:hypothetical protein